MSEEENVTVRRQWNCWRTDVCSLHDIDGIHWSWFSGGVRAPSPQPFLYGYVSRERVPELDYSGMHGPCPHEIKVCIVKKDNSRKLFAKLVEIAGPKPKTKEA